MLGKLLTLDPSDLLPAGGPAVALGASWTTNDNLPVRLHCETLLVNHELVYWKSVPCLGSGPACVDVGSIQLPRTQMLSQSHATTSLEEKLDIDRPEMTAKWLTVRASVSPASFSG